MNNKRQLSQRRFNSDSIQSIQPSQNYNLKLYLEEFYRNQPNSNENEGRNDSYSNYNTDSAYEKYMQNLKMQQCLVHQQSLQTPHYNMSVQSNQTFMNSNGFNNALKEHTENVLNQIQEVNEKYRYDCRDHLSESTIKSSIYQKVKNDSQMQYDLTEEKDNRRANTTIKKNYQGQRQVLMPQESYIITTAGPSPQQSFVEYALCSFGDATITPQIDFQAKSTHQHSKQTYCKSMIDRILECLDLQKYQSIFKDQEVNNLNDFVLLEKQDLIELGIPIGARNRIMAFNQYYQNNGSQVDFNKFQLDDIVCLKSKQKNTRQLNPSETLTREDFEMEDQPTDRTFNQKRKLPFPEKIIFEHSIPSIRNITNIPQNDKSLTPRSPQQPTCRHIQQNTQQNFPTNQSYRSREKQKNTKEKDKLQFYTLKSEVNQILHELNNIINREYSDQQSEIQESPSTFRENEIENINKEIRDYTQEYQTTSIIQKIQPQIQNYNSTNTTLNQQRCLNTNGQNTNFRVIQDQLRQQDLPKFNQISNKKNAITQCSRILVDKCVETSEINSNRNMQSNRPVIYQQEQQSYQLSPPIRNQMQNIKLNQTTFSDFEAINYDEQQHHNILDQSIQYIQDSGFMAPKRKIQKSKSLNCTRSKLTQLERAKRDIDLISSKALQFQQRLDKFKLQQQHLFKNVL